jgi:uncharacterized phage-associated protein
MSNPVMKPPIRFRFDPEKFVACLTFFSSKAKNMDKLKAAKLLYYVDKYHLVRYGRPILGDVYYRLDFGPVPSMALDIMNEAIHPYPLRKIPQTNLELLRKYLRVDRGTKRHPVFELKAHPDMEVLSESEKEALEETVKEYGRYSGPQLIDLTHGEATWKKTRQNDVIDYRLFFEGARDASPEALEYLESLQENLELVFSLSAPA